MSDPITYTVARYDHPHGGGEAHGFYVLEQKAPDGTTTPLAAIHGMATEADGSPSVIGMPWSGDTIQGHLYMDPNAPPPGIVRPSNVRIGENPKGTAPFADGTPSAGTIAGPQFMMGKDDSPVRRGDIGQMSQDQATGKFNQMLQGASAINDKKDGYDPAGGPNSNTFNKHMGEIAADPGIGKIDQSGQSLGYGGEYNKPGWGDRILSPDEVRAINPKAGIVSYPQSGPLDSPQIRSVITNGDGSRIETYGDGSTGSFDAAGKPIPAATPAAPAATAPAADGQHSDADKDDDDAPLTDADAAQLTQNFAPDSVVLADPDA